MTKIGLEIHCQLTNLQSKLFCSCKANYREFEPNENICPVCAGMPGSLPRLNQEAVKKATMISMALNCSTPEKIALARTTASSHSAVHLFAFNIAAIYVVEEHQTTSSMSFAFKASPVYPASDQLLGFRSINGNNQNKKM